MRYDVVAVGELLIDFTPAGANETGNLLFARNPGGAPANVAVAHSRLGGKTAFIGKVGDDAFGAFLRETLDGCGVDTRGLAISGEVPTTLAFVQLDAKGDRSFSFYRHPGADIMLSPSDLDLDLLQNTNMLHFGSVSLTDDPSRTATLEAVRMAKEAGAIISFDPNYRPPLWRSPEDALEQIRAALPLADIVKVSEEELALITGERELDAGALSLRRMGAGLVLVTLGAKGAYYRLGDHSGSMKTYRVRTIDTNGAGDSFTGALHYALRGRNLAAIGRMTDEEIRDAVDFANAAGSLTTTRHGAIPAMPTLDEITACRAATPLLDV